MPVEAVVAAHEEPGDEEEQNDSESDDREHPPDRRGRRLRRRGLQDPTALACLYCSVTEYGRACAVNSKNGCEVLTGFVTGCSEATGAKPEVNCGTANVSTSHTPIAASNAIERRRANKTVTMPTSANTLR